jgi:DNA-binding NarL/FixJ family response regulator
MSASWSKRLKKVANGKPSIAAVRFNPLRIANIRRNGEESVMSEHFERHRQPWRQDEVQKLHQLAGKGMSVRAIAKALTRSEESVRDRAKADKVKIAKLR